jgi:hypothetical protein
MRIPLFPIILLSMLQGCAGSGEPSGQEDDSGNQWSEDTWYSEVCGEPGETYTAGISHEGDLGVLEFILVDTDPTPPDKGDNSFRIQVNDMALGVPVDGASVIITPFMPEHGHGTSPEYHETAPAGEAGQYQSDVIDLFMAGLWEINFSADQGGVTLDLSTFRFCLEG